MVDTKNCHTSWSHEPHNWSEMVKTGFYDETGKRQHYWCEGVEREMYAEGKTERLAQITYRDITKLSFDLVTREKVPSRFTFADLLAGDARAVVTVVEGADKWAVVDIRILARKPFTVQEIDEEETSRRLF